MADQILNARILLKHDIEANWEKAENFKPKKGEIIIYDADENNKFQRIKIGDGETLPKGLPFIDYGKPGIVEGNIIKGAEIFNDYADNVASGWYSHAEGCGATAKGNYSHAEGKLNYAYGTGSHAEGSSEPWYVDPSTLTVEELIAEWEKNSRESSIAMGDSSHVEGTGNMALREGSHAEGRSNLAQGPASHAEGRDTKAVGVASHAEGRKTIAGSSYQHVQGVYNIEDSDGKYAHIIGNGSARGRANAHTVDWDGNAWFSGNIKIGGTGQDDENAKALATQDYVNAAVSNVVAAQIITWEDDD